MCGILSSRAEPGLNKRADLGAGVGDHAVPAGVSATGQVHVWPSGSLWLGSGRGRTGWHAHHAHQITLRLAGGFRFRSERSGPWLPFEGALVASHCPHEFELDPATVAHLFVEPESAAGRALSQRYAARAISALPAAPVQACVAVLRDMAGTRVEAPAAQAVGRALITRLAGLDTPTPPTQALDARVARALDFVRARIRAPVSLAQAADAAALSASRFRHLFVQETGTSFRAYLLWLRLNVAIEAAMAGASWTEAAHEAGFADSSHLSRTHKRMFGIEPTAIRHGA